MNLGSNIPRDPVDLDGYVPPFGNPGALINHRRIPTDDFHRCADCDVSWRGNGGCWSCGDAA